MPNAVIGRALAVLLLVPALWAPASLAAEPTFELTIRNHRFEPEALTVPAKTRIKLLIHNADPTPEEFESYELNREKVIPGGAEATIYLGPLDAGTYPFFGEFHQKTAKGKIVAQ